MPRVVCIIQARLGSTRLPGKVLMDIGGKPLLAHVVERALAIRGVDVVVVNVPQQDFCQINEVVTADADVVGVINQERDVLGSYLEVAHRQNADVIMRLTGDCPLLDPSLCEQVLNLYQKLADPYVIAVNDTNLSGFPDGTDAEVFSIEALDAAANCARDPSHREHVTLWMREELTSYSILAPRGQAITGAKWSVDTAEDLNTVRTIYSQLEPGQFGWQETAKAWRQAGRP